MHRVLITVASETDEAPCDLEVPAEVPAIQLDRLIARALHWEQDAAGLRVRHSIFVDPPGRLLGSRESLQEAGVCDGAALRLATFVSAFFESPAGTIYPLHRAEVILGRAQATATDDLLDLAGEEAGQRTVSKQHAAVAFTKGQWQLAHLSSVNETVLNGHVLDPEDRLALKEGDRVELGAVSLIFHIGDPPNQPLLTLP